MIRLTGTHKPSVFPHTDAPDFDRPDIREANNSVDGVVPDGQILEGQSRSVRQHEQHRGWWLVSSELRWTGRLGALVMTASEMHCEEQRGDEPPFHCVLLRVEA